jgi:hypothetical protein
MLTLLHSFVGTLVIVANLAAGLWYSFRNPPGVVGSRLLLLARISLTVQILLGLALVAQGYVGQNVHYAGALAAVVVAWVTGQQAHTASHPYRVLAGGHLLVGLCATLAYLMGQGR